MDTSSGSGPAATGTSGAGAATPASAGGAAVPAGTTGNAPLGTGTGGGSVGRPLQAHTSGKGGEQVKAGTVTIRGGLTDNPDAENDDSEAQAYIDKGKKAAEQKALDTRKAAGMNASEAKEDLAKTKGHGGKAAKKTPKKK